MIHTIKSSGQKITIQIKGRLTYTDYNSFRQISEMLGTTEGQQCSIDLSELEFIDSAGLGMLLLARDKVFEKKGTISLKGSHGQVRKMIELGKFDTLFLIET
ncbi:MAG: STAS-domain containing protein [Holosporales bacterium]